MALAYVQVAKNGRTTNGTTVAAVFPGNTTTGNLIVVGVIVNQTTDTISGIADSQGNTYTKIRGRRVATTGAYFCTLWYAKNITGGTTPTVTVTSTSAQFNVQAFEISGADTATPLDAQSDAGGTTTAITGGTTAATTTAAEMVIMAGFSDFGNNGYTVGAGYTGLQIMANAAQDMAMQYKIVAATGTQSGTMTLANASDNAGIIATFKQGTSGQTIAPTGFSTIASLGVPNITATPPTNAAIAPAGILSTSSIGVPDIATLAPEEPVTSWQKETITPTSWAADDLPPPTSWQSETPNTTIWR
jgi:hypothetical protein